MCHWQVQRLLAQEMHLGERLARVWAPQQGAGVEPGAGREGLEGARG